MPQHVPQNAVIFLLNREWMTCTSVKLGHASIKFGSHFVVFNFKDVFTGIVEATIAVMDVNIWLNSVGIQFSSIDFSCCILNLQSFPLLKPLIQHRIIDSSNSPNAFLFVVGSDTCLRLYTI